MVDDTDLAGTISYLRKSGQSAHGTSTGRSDVVVPLVDDGKSNFGRAINDQNSSAP
jgi:hypothetical protein